MHNTFLILIIICNLLASCQSERSNIPEEFKNSDQVVRIAATEDPHTLDPRFARNLETATFLHMLYEGIMRLNYHGKPEMALAQNVSLSSDQKTYTFKLRKSVWSNGDALNAYDFERTWKSILSPEVAAPNAYQLYVIKGAKAAKEGKSSLEDVGIKALDQETLEIELEAPTPYFLDLLAAHFFYPVHPKSTSDLPIGNGPFKLKKWQRRNALLVEKNPHFWEASEVRLDGIVVYILDEHTALRMFEKSQLDWTGSPIGTLPQDSISTLKHHHKLELAPAAGTHWFRFNTEKAPFNNVKLREAFTLALNRTSIVNHVTQGGQKPAEAIVPITLGLKTHSFFEDNDTPKAWYAFQEALQELKLSIDDFPKITLCYSANDRNHKIAQAVQQQWNKAFGISLDIEHCEGKVFYERLKQHDFQIASGSWFADFRDPINFLDIFKFKNGSTNNTNWENEKYIELLNASSVETDHEKRFHLLNEAQALLMHEYPVAPLFFSVFNYVKNENLLGVYFSDLGFLDFKYAFFGS